MAYQKAVSVNGRVVYTLIFAHKLFVCISVMSTLQ